MIRAFEYPAFLSMHQVVTLGLELNITDLNLAYLEHGKPQARLIGRGIALLDRCHSRAPGSSEKVTRQ